MIPFGKTVTFSAALIKHSHDVEKQYKNPNANVLWNRIMLIHPWIDGCLCTAMAEFSIYERPYGLQTLKYLISHCL